MIQEVTTGKSPILDHAYELGPEFILHYNFTTGRYDTRSAEGTQLNGGVEIILSHLMNTYHHPQLAVAPGAGMLRVTLTVGHGRVMFGSKVGLQFSVPNATEESLRCQECTQFYEMHDTHVRAARGADAHFMGTNGNFNAASGLGFEFGLRNLPRSQWGSGDEWRDHNNPDIPDDLSDYGESTKVGPDPGASGNPPQMVEVGIIRRPSRGRETSTTGPCLLAGPQLELGGPQRP